MHMSESRPSLRAPRLRVGSTVEASGIIAAADRVTELRRQNVDVISMGIGESDLGTPKHVLDAVDAALATETFRCTSPAGSLPLREALRTWMRDEYDLEFATDEVLLSAGSKLGLYGIFRSMLDEGDEVIIPVPAWPTIKDMVLAVGGRPVFVPCEEADGFSPSADQLAAAMSTKTRLIYIANPGNRKRSPPRDGIRLTA